MTQESVSELEPGPELDERVAEILGWDWYHFEEHRYADNIEPYNFLTYYDASKATDCHVGKNPDYGVAIEGVPEFSSSHEAAARIKEYLRDQDIQFSIHWPMGRNHVLVGDSILEVQAESEPLALCRFLARLDHEGVLNHD